MKDQLETKVLLLGHVDHEGISSFLTQTGRGYVKRLLDSKPENWLKTCAILRPGAVESTVSCVLGKLAPSVLTLLTLPKYADARRLLFESVRDLPHLFFVYEGLFAPDPEPEAETGWDSYFHRPTDENLAVAFKFLEENKINFVPYRHNAEVTVMAQRFLEENESGLLFRLYVPNARLWANEANRLLSLFREYLVRVEKRSVRLDEVRTEKGAIYELHSDDASAERSISTEFDDFTRLMDFCVSSPEKAEKILQDKAVNSSEVAEIITRYAKEARRIVIDMKHDREQKMLSVRQRLESELADILPPHGDVAMIDSLVSSVVPQVQSGTIIQALPQPSEHTIPQQLTVNFSPQIIESVSGIVASEVRGDAMFNEHDQKLVSLFQEYAGDQKDELTNALYELNDESAPKPGRVTAKQRIKKFLYSVGGKLGDVGAGVLEAYIEKKILGL